MVISFLFLSPPPHLATMVFFKHPHEEKYPPGEEGDIVMKFEAIYSEEEEMKGKGERGCCEGWVPVDLITECYRSRPLFVSSLFVFITVVFLGNAFGSGHSCEYTHVVDFEGLEERNVTCGIWEDEWKYSGEDDSGRVLGVSVSLATTRFLFSSMGNSVYHSPFWLVLSLMGDVMALVSQWGDRLYCQNECLYVFFCCCCCCCCSCGCCSILL